MGKPANRQPEKRPTITTVALLDRNVQRFRGGLEFKEHRLCVSLNSRLEGNKEEEETGLDEEARLEPPASYAASCCRAAEHVI